MKKTDLTALQIYHKVTNGDKSGFLIAGINDQGLYRVGGVSSKVQKLLSLMIGK